MENKIICVGFYGQPSAGKSTAAAALFVYLKNKGCNVELVREYAKELTYSKRQHELYNQVALLAEQYKRMKDIAEYKQVPMIITDCPIMLGLAYSQDKSYVDELTALSKKLDTEFENINVFVERSKPYNPSGRNQTEEESDKISKIILALPVVFNYFIKGDETGQNYICHEVYRLFKDRIKY